MCKQRTACCPPADQWYHFWLASAKESSSYYLCVEYFPQFSCFKTAAEIVYISESNEKSFDLIDLKNVHMRCFQNGELDQCSEFLAEFSGIAKALQMKTGYLLHISYSRLQFIVTTNFFITQFSLFSAMSELDITRCKLLKEGGLFILHLHFPQYCIVKYVSRKRFQSCMHTYLVVVV